MKDTFQSPEWWASVVVVGIVLNVGSSYLKNWIDRTIGKRRHKALSKTKAYEMVLDVAASRIRDDPYGVIIHFQRALHERIRGLGFIVIGFVAVVSGPANNVVMNLVLSVFGGVCIGVGIVYGRQANEMTEVAKRACKHHAEEQQPTGNQKIDERHQLYSEAKENTHEHIE